MARWRRSSGFTYIEMITVAAILAVLVLIATPFVHKKHRHLKELELKRTLNIMREAIDRYHEYALLGQIEPWDLDWQMYPKDLQMLVDGVEVRPAVDQEPISVRFLREIPVDPMTGEAEWSCRAYDDEPEEREDDCDNLYDVFSKSEDTCLDGTHTYNEW